MEAEFLPLQVGTLLGEGGRERPDFKILTGELHIFKAADSADGKKRIRCIASSSVKDLHGDVMTPHCVRSMAKQATGLTAFLNHSYKIPEDVFGKIEKSRTKTMSAADAKAQGFLEKGAPDDDVVLLELVILEDESNARAEKTYATIENGITLGVSIGALITDWEEDPEYDGDWWAPLIINDVDLLEASIVGLPANPLSWVEGATKGLIAKGAIPGASENDFNRMRLSWRSAEAKKEAPVDPEDEPVESDEPATEAEAKDEPEAPQAEAETEKFLADGIDQIIAFYQIAVEEKTMAATDLDAMEDAIAASIAYAIASGVDAKEFAGRTAKEIASEILSSEPAPDEPDAAGAEANPTDDQDAPPESNPESGDAGVDGETQAQAEAQLTALREGGALDGLVETIGVLGDTLKALITERAKSTDLEARNLELATQLASANGNVQAAVEVVNRLMSLPIGRKSVTRREVENLADRLKGGPYSGELLAYIAKYSSEGATDAP